MTQQDGAKKQLIEQLEKVNMRLKRCEPWGQDKWVK